MQDVNYTIGLSFFEGIGPVRYKLLRDFFGSSRDIFEATEKELIEVGLSENLVKKFVMFKNSVNLEKIYDNILKKKICVITETDSLYPNILKQVEGHPFILYLLGKKELLAEKRKIAIVGTRKPTSYGKDITRKFSENLSRSGCTIVSGMAMGIDAVAHLAALDTSGKTIAVLGCGVDICYPQVNYALYERLKKEALIISEFPPGMRTSRGVFPSRNRIVAGMSDVIIVTEGGERSGSLITASFGAEYGRDVYAVPGPVTSPLSFASNSLLRKGAKIAIDPSDILDDMHITPTKKLEIHISLNDEEKKIVNLFSIHNSLHIDEISRNLKKDVSTLSVELSILTMKGVLQEMDGGEYTIKT